MLLSAFVITFVFGLAAGSGIGARQEASVLLVVHHILLDQASTPIAFLFVHQSFLPTSLFVHHFFM